MKLAFRFTITLVAAMTIALVLNAYLRVQREVVLFELSGTPLEEAEYTRQAVVSAGATALALALLCAVSTMTLGLFFVGRPVRALVAQARRIGAGDFSEPLRLRQRDEIGELAQEFDAMRERLAQARDELRGATEAKLAALAQLRHAERLATVGKLAAGVAHELGTPLQAVSGYARLIVDDDSCSADAKENAAVIEEQAGRIGDIIRQLLDFARRRPAARRPTNLAEVVERAARLLTPMAEKASVALTLKIEEPNLEAMVDGEQIMQVISNLIVNAVQAMPSGGSVTLELGRRSRSVAGIDKPFVYLAVRDTGVGMPPQVRDHVFEPFFTTKGVGGGTGLGLSVAHGIVEEQAGVLEVDSTEGKGSTFAVWLPAGGAT